MLNYSALIERIEELRQKHQLNASSFADRIGVPRSSISHILSGRNKPSLEFVIKTVDAFEDISLEELLYGRKAPLHSPPPPPSLPKISSELFDEVDPPALEDKPTNSPVSTETPERVIVLYPDGRFETYLPKKP